MEIIIMGGSEVMALKKENGARLKVSLPLSESTQAIGRGITVWQRMK